MRDMSYKLGSQPMLILHKLGFDLRKQLDDTLAAPLPPRLRELCDELMGFADWRDVDRRERRARDRTG